MFCQSLSKSAVLIHKCFIQVEAKKNFLDLSMREPEKAASASAAPAVGAMINGQVTSVSGTAFPLHDTPDMHVWQQQKSC